MTTAGLSFGQLPHGNTSTFYLLADLHGTTHGRTWLACSAKGECCVLKFCEDTEAAKREAQVWETYTELGKARTINLMLRPCVIMPYVKQCTALDASKPEVKLAAKTAIAALAKNHWRHDDLKWEHVGLYENKRSELCAVLFDFGSASQLGTRRECEDARMLMEGKLGL